MEWSSLYVPHRHQRRFHSLPHREALFLGGVGAGKTLTGVHESVFLAQDNPLCDGCITSPTYPMLRDVIIPLWEEWVPEHLYTWKKSDQCFLWHPTGRKIFLRSADRPGRISGLNLAWAWLDEATQLLKPDVWNILRARIRDPRAQRRRLFTTTTPMGYNWLIKEFRHQGGVIRARTADNISLADDFESGLRAKFGREYAAQYLDALILELQGLAWPIQPRVHSDWSLAWARRRCHSFFGAVDWGHAKPAALLVGGVDWDGRWYLVDEWYKRGKLHEEIAEQAKLMTDKWGVRRWWADGAEPEACKHLGLKGVPWENADKSVISGVQHVRSHVAVRNDGEPHLYVHRDLENWHRECDGYTFPGDDAKEPEVPVGANGDHLMDTTRYMLYSHSTMWTGGVDYKGGERGRMGASTRSLH
jgi:hypothetical protein